MLPSEKKVSILFQWKVFLSFDIKSCAGGMLIPGVCGVGMMK
jgi:hypothetical protein